MTGVQTCALPIYSEMAEPMGSMRVAQRVSPVTANQRPAPHEAGPPSGPHREWQRVIRPSWRRGGAGRRPNPPIKRARTRRKDIETHCAGSGQPEAQLLPRERNLLISPRHEVGSETSPRFSREQNHLSALPPHDVDGLDHGLPFQNVVSLDIDGPIRWAKRKPSVQQGPELLPGDALRVEIDHRGDSLPPHGDAPIAHFVVWVQPVIGWIRRCTVHRT